VMGGDGLKPTSPRTKHNHAPVPLVAPRRRRLRRFTIGVSEDDLRVIARYGYEGALSTDHEQPAQAVSRFITDALAARLDR
jgi:hypothetical protein